MNGSTLQTVISAALVVGALVMPTTASAIAGELDPSFSGDGKATTPKLPFTGETAEAVVIQDDGRIVLVGRSENEDSGDLRAVAYRYLENGTLDPDFGDGTGRAVLPVSPAQAYDAAALSDGRIAIAGQLNVAGDWQFVVMLLDSEGNLDGTFGDAGVAVLDFGPDHDIAYGVAVDDSDRIMVVGRVETSNGLAFGVARLNATGTPDPGFSSDGQRIIRFRGGAIATDVAVQPNGRVVVVGWTNSGRFAIARLLDDGSLDPAFGDDGRATTQVGGGGANAVALQSDGRIVVAGADGADFVIVRYRLSGALDLTFAKRVECSRTSVTTRPATLTSRTTSS